MKIAISEVFYSIQGEGKTTGIPSVFIRLGGCNLMCGGMGTQFDGKLHGTKTTWRCDTIEVWMNAQMKDIKDVLNEDMIFALQNNAHLVITGGEPLIQQDRLVCFIEYIKTIVSDLYIEIETNGTIIPNQYLCDNVNLWNCSPKLESSGNDISVRINKQAITTINKLNSIFKFVIGNDLDYKEIEKDYIPLMHKYKIWLMPHGENLNLLNKSKLSVVEIAKNNYLNFCSRLHIDIWDKKTGV